MGQSNKFLALLSFALGIETAQIIIGLLILLGIWFVLKSKIINRRELILLLSGGIVGYILSVLI